MYVHVRYLCMPLFYSPDSDRPTNHFGGLDVAPGCHCRVPFCSVLYGWGAKGDDQFWWVVVVPLQGAIVVCYEGGG